LSLSTAWALTFLSHHHRILIYIDNPTPSTFSSLHARLIYNPILLTAVDLLVLLNAEIHILHVPRRLNSVTDALAPFHNAEASTLPPKLIYQPFYTPSHWGPVSHEPRSSSPDSLHGLSGPIVLSPATSTLSTALPAPSVPTWPLVITSSYTGLYTQYQLVHGLRSHFPADIARQSMRYGRATALAQDGVSLDQTTPCATRPTQPSPGPLNLQYPLHVFFSSPLFALLPSLFSTFPLPSSPLSSLLVYKRATVVFPCILVPRAVRPVAPRRPLSYGYSQPVLFW
jgi:hypothetical protein